MSNRKGRPSMQSSLSIQKELREYFQQGHDPEFTASQTRHDIKTVRKYFSQFAKEISESDTEDFLDKQKTDRIRTIMSFDRQIFEANQYAQGIKSDMKTFRDEKKLPPKHLLSLYLEVMKFIANLTETKGSFVMEPMPDKVLEQVIDEKLEKYGKTK